MNSKTVGKAFALVLCVMPALVFAQRPRQITIQVLDDRGQSVEGAEVKARYLATVRQGNKEQHVPMELAAPQMTDVDGRCTMKLQDVSWSLAAIQAHRPGMKTEDANNLFDDAPSEPSKLVEFERQVKDQVERYSAAHQVLVPGIDANQVITLKMKKTIKVTGRVQVDGEPLAKAHVSIFAPPTEIDQLFPRTCPSPTDDTGHFSFYSIPGEFNRARIVVERANGNRVLNLTGLSAQPTPDGLRFEFATMASDYLPRNQSDKN